jgi:ATP-dependent Clp protease ATP-binding subunit ClpX
MPLAGVTFIACGAFSGMKTSVEGLARTERLGFGREVRSRDEGAIAELLTDEQLEQTAAFARYGFLPELIGRFTRIVSFAPLEARTLEEILQANVLLAYEREFAQEGLRLVVEPEVRQHVVARALKRETGARGLRAALSPVLERAAYDCFGQRCGGTVRLVLHDERVEALTG